MSSVELKEKKFNRQQEKIKILERIIEEKSKDLFFSMERNQQVNTIMNYSPLLILTVNVNGAILSSNHLADAAFGLTDEKSKIWANTGSSIKLEDLWSIIENNEEVQIEDKLGENVFLFTLKGISHYNLAVVFAANITDRKKIENELNKERVRGLHAVKMATLGEMAGGMAHEINTPLGSILIGVDQIGEMLDKLKVKDEITNEILDDIRSAVNRISRIIKSLKSYGRDNSQGKFIFANFFEIIDDVQTLCQIKLKNSSVLFTIHIENKDEREKYVINCNPTQICQVLVNLVHNAHDAIENLKNKWVKIFVKSDDDHIYILVVDSGKGISEEDEKKIFAPFYTTKEIGKGTGLGLSISQNIIRSHGGELTINRKIPNTCFEIKLPKIQPT